jgi:Secretion system C-terminal sorting domain
MKKYILILLLFPIFVFAQKENNIWILGYDDAPSSIDYGFGNTTLNFNSSPVNIQYKSRLYDFYATYSSICDPATGRLLFYTNGISIKDSTNQIILNGDSINCCNSLWTNFRTIGYTTPQGSLILQQPNHPNIYYLFHQLSLYVSNPATICTPELRYTIIDMNGNNGKGRVLQKNIPIIPHSLNGTCFSACRHGNGRDWWITVQSFDLSRLYTLLLTPDGIQGPFTQVMRPIDVNAYCGGGPSCFTPNGEKYALYDSKIGTQIYDFDRCAGVFSNEHIIPTSPNIANLVPSPNSEFAYLVYTTHIKQINLNAFTSDTVAVYDDFYWLNGTTRNYTAFAFPALAPDGKIYISCWGSNRYLHTIENPDAAGTACNVQQHSIWLPTWNNGTINIAPNYRLGVKVGSGCDTITVATSGSPPLRDLGGLRLFPNPTQERTRLVWDEPLRTAASIHITNSIGQVVKSIVVEKGFTYQDIEVKDLPNGLYFVSIYENNNLLGSQKFVVQHE